MLVVLVLAGSLLAGYGTPALRARSWLHIARFALIIAGSILRVLDYEYPRAGLIRIDPIDQVLIDLRSSMN